MKRTIKIHDTLDERAQNVRDEVKNLFHDYLSDHPNVTAEKIEEDDSLFDSLQEIAALRTPLFTQEINDLFYLYDEIFNTTLDNAGLGSRDDKCLPCSWQAAAIRCYLEQIARDAFGDLIEQLKEKQNQ